MVFRTLLGSNYVDAWSQLEASKVSQFKDKNPLKWGLDPEVLKVVPQGSLIADEGLARPLIYADRTKALKNAQIVFGYSNTRLITEWENLMVAKTKRLAGCMTEFSSDNRGHCAAETKIFGEIEQAMIRVVGELPNPPMFYDGADVERIQNLMKGKI
jgi:hypothetical protein